MKLQKQGFLLAYNQKHYLSQTVLYMLLKLTIFQPKIFPPCQNENFSNFWSLMYCKWLKIRKIFILNLNLVFQTQNHSKNFGIKLVPSTLCLISTLESSSRSLRLQSLGKENAIQDIWCQLQRFIHENLVREEFLNSKELAVWNG